MTPQQLELTDQVISHQIALQRYSTGQVRKILALLNRADADLFAQLLVVLGSVDFSTFQAERLEGLLASVRAISAGAYRQAGEMMAQDLQAFAGYEVGYQHQLFESLDVSLTLNAVSPAQAYAAAMARPFQGVLLREVFAEAEASKTKRIRDTIRMGMVEGKTVDQLVRQLRGTKARGYEDGVIELDRRHVEAIVRTAISHTANVARNQYFEVNADILGSLMWLSTLDSRTSPTCIARSGKRYTVKGHKPIGHKLPWGGGPGAIHWRCRSVSLPLLDGQDDFTGDQSSEDGPVDANLTYGAWLKRQPAAKQDDILGKTRGALFRRGGLTIDRFTDDRGRWYSLEELKAQDKKAFETANV